MRPLSLNRIVALFLLCLQVAQATSIEYKDVNLSELPDIGDPTGTLMTAQQETELGKAFYYSLFSQMKISQDPEITDYIQSLGSRLTIESDKPSQYFKFFVVIDPVINAFAGPGGYIGVNSGLILLSEEESELASVISHEIAHVTQRHMFQAFQAASRLNLPSAIAMIGAAVLGAKGGYSGSQAAQAAMVGIQAANAQYQINFTRDNEAEADRVGMQIMSKSEFDPRAMPAFFEKMQQSTRFSGNHLPEFLLTHPVTVSRISDTRDRAEKFTYKQYPDSFVYQIIKAKLRVLTKPPKEALEYFRLMSGRGMSGQQDVNIYGLALAQTKLGQYEPARTALQRLVQVYPHQSQFINALGDVEMQSRNFKKAAQIYDLALQRFPGNEAMTLNYTRALLNSGEAAKSKAMLHSYIKYHPPTPDIYELMAETYQRLGDEAEQHRYYAEGYHMLGMTQQAILQLQLAKRSAGNNFYLNSVLDERMSEWVAEERGKPQDKNQE
jgi:predicted Zn-dependent protease